jgi:predicted HTH transcriptional regulator
LDESVGNLCQHIYWGKEDREREYKAPMPWTDDLAKAKITRAILAMSNTIDGGVIIVGMKELEDKTFDSVGLSEADVSTFNHDTIADYLKEYADPYVKFTVRPIECDGKKFICIQVLPFDESPVICKKSGRDLEKGRIYTRSRTKNESAPVSSYAEMREILDLATDKAVRKQWSRLPCAGFLPTPPSEDAKRKFAEQRKDLQ